MVLLAVVMALVTAGFMATVGRRVMLRSSIIATLIGGAFLPVLMNAGAFALTVSNPARTDGGGTFVFAALVLSICALPVTIATSVLYVVMQRRSVAR